MKRLARCAAAVCCMVTALSPPAHRVGGIRQRRHVHSGRRRRTQLEMHVTANCVLADKQCYFTTARQSDDAARASTGFPG